MIMKNSAKCGNAMPIEPGNNVIDPAVGCSPDGFLSGLDLSSLRFVANGAEPVSIHTLRRFIERFSRFGFRPGAMAPVYGLAECAVALALPPPGREPLIDRINREALTRRGVAEPTDVNDPDPIEIVACGRPVPCHEIRIVDEAGREVQERRVGRLEFVARQQPPAIFTTKLRRANCSAVDGSTVAIRRT